MLKLKIFGIFQNANFWNLWNGKFLEFSELEVFGIFRIGNFGNFPDRIFAEFSNLEGLEFFKFVIFGIFVVFFQIEKFWNFPNSKMIKFPEFYSWENQQIFIIYSIWKAIQLPKIGKFFTCYSTRYSASLAVLPILIFALWYKLFILLTHKLVRYTFERSFVNFQIRNVCHSQILLFEI